MDGNFVGIGYARNIAEARESVERTRDALERNLGNQTGEDWRDALGRAEARLARLEGSATQQEGAPMTYEQLALDAERRAEESKTEGGREFWLRRASFYWLRAPVRIETEVRQINLEGFGND